MASRTVAQRTALSAWNRFARSSAVDASSTMAATRSWSTQAAATISRPNQHFRWFSDKAAEATATEQAETATDETAPPTDNATGEQAPETPPKPTKEEELEAQTKELKDQLLRSLAEQDNTRRIAKRDVDQARQYAIKSFAKSLLDVADNLQRAMEAVPKDQINKDKEPVLANLYEGIELTEKGLIKSFESNGLVKFGKPGEVFDPNRHEALYEYPDPKQTPGTVGQVMKSGYLLNQRVLRPAEVGVIKKE